MTNNMSTQDHTPQRITPENPPQWAQQLEDDIVDIAGTTAVDHLDTFRASVRKLIARHAPTVPPDGGALREAQRAEVATMLERFFSGRWAQWYTVDRICEVFAATPATVFPETEGEDRQYYEEGMELLCDRLDAERRATTPPSRGASSGHEQLREAVDLHKLAKRIACAVCDEPDENNLDNHQGVYAMAEKVYPVLTALAPFVQEEGRGVSAELRAACLSVGNLAGKHEQALSELATLRARHEQVERERDEARSRASLVETHVAGLQVQAAAARKDSERLDALEYDAAGRTIGYVCVFMPYASGGDYPVFAPQGGKVRDVIDAAIAARPPSQSGEGKQS